MHYTNSPVTQKLRQLPAAILALLSILVLLTLSGCSDGSAGEGADPSDMPSYDVVRVVDGDTIIIDMDGTEERVRMIGVDTPESVAPEASRNVPFGKVASEFTKSQLVGKQVSLEYDVSERDQYDRILAYVYLDGKMFNKTLIEEGYARTVTFPPDVKYADELAQLQSEAREAGKGVWEDFESAFPGKDKPKETGLTDHSNAEYAGNQNSKKFHTLDCSGVQNISSHNLVHFESRQAAIDSGYAPCGTCNP